MTSRNMVDVKVALGLASPPLPKICSVREFAASPPPAPPMIVDGFLHQGCKLLLGGTSKSNKTWALLDLALSVASGASWWGHATGKAKVLYINFELPQWALARRIDAICEARPELGGIGDQLFLWNLRGHAADLTTLRPQLEEGAGEKEFGLVIIDPAYKLLGDRDENANGDIGDFMNECERFAERSGAAVVIAHHFAKGDSSVKEAIDRMAGAGAWARDPDSILVMTPHEEENCFSVTSILRCLPQVPEFVVEWEYPLLRKAGDLDPGSLRTRSGRQKACTDREFLDAIPTRPTSRKILLEKCGELGLSERTFDRYLKRLIENGVICTSSGLYWRKE